VKLDSLGRPTTGRRCEARPGTGRASYGSLRPPGAWVDESACAGHANPDLWFPRGLDIRVVWEATAVCEQCPVIKQCLAYAVDHPDLEGIWGGKTGGERKRIRRGGR
jgi:WhiB family redox-sensing transcriptional regulator